MTQTYLTQWKTNRGLFPINPSKVNLICNFIHQGKRNMIIPEPPCEWPPPNNWSTNNMKMNPKLNEIPIMECISTSGRPGKWEWRVPHAPSTALSPSLSMVNSLCSWLWWWPVPSEPTSPVCWSDLLLWWCSWLCSWLCLWGVDAAEIRNQTDIVIDQTDKNEIL